MFDSYIDLEFSQFKSHYQSQYIQIQQPMFDREYNRGS